MRLLASRLVQKFSPSGDALRKLIPLHRQSGQHTMASTRKLNVQAFPRPPLLEKIPGKHIQIRWHGEIIADTDQAYWLLETHHAPSKSRPPPSPEQRDFFSCRTNKIFSPPPRPGVDERETLEEKSEAILVLLLSHWSPRKLGFLLMFCSASTFQPTTSRRSAYACRCRQPRVPRFANGRAQRRITR